MESHKGRTGLVVLGALALVFTVAAAGCQDNMNLGGIRPYASLGQDWNGDGKIEALPSDPANAGDYLVDFGQVVVKQKASRAIILANDNNAKAKLVWQSIKLGQDSSVFFLDLPPVAEIDPGATTAFTIHYIPLQDAKDEDTVVVVTNDPDHKTMTIHLTGEGVTPQIQVCLVDSGQEQCDDAVAPANLKADFGMNKLLDVATKDFLIRNKGAYMLTVQSGGGRQGVDFSTGTSSEFSLSPSPWSGALNPGETRNFTVEYSPFDGGADNAKVEITSNDPVKPLVQIDLVGNGLAPKICPQPPFIVDFGTVMVNSVNQKSYHFTSCGNLTLTITALTLDSGNHGFYTFTTPITTPFDLSPGQGFDIGITYAPTQEGAHAGKITIQSNDPAADQGYIDLIGRASPVPTCALTVVPNPVDFGTVSTSGFSSKAVYLQNTGTAECIIERFDGPTGSPTFTLETVPALPLHIPIGEQANFSVKYQPTAQQDDQGTVTVVVTGLPSVDVNLKGTGIQPPPCSLQADPPNLNFGSVPQGGNSTLSTTIYNFGSEDCNIWSWGMVTGSNPSFSVSALPFPFPTLAPGQSVKADVTLVPQSGGLLTATLEVKGGVDPLHIVRVDVPLSGGGQAAQMCINPPVLDFGPVAAGSFKDLTFDISACGPGNLKIRQVTFDGNNPHFTFGLAPGAPFTVLAGSKKTITVRYGPTTLGGDFGRVVVSSNDAQNPTGIVELKGNYSGTCPSVFDCQPNALTFPSTAIGQSSDLSFTCTNHGSQALTVTDVSAGAGTSPEFRISAPGIPLQVDPGRELQVEVSYIPVDVGVDTGSVRITSQFSASGCDNFTLITVPLSAEGKTPNYPPCIPPKQFQPTLKFAWPNGSISNPTFKQVFMTPVVANLNDDNGDGFINEDDIPDIVFNAYEKQNMNQIWETGMIRAISGDDGHEIFAISDPRFKTNYETQIAIGDIDGDNLPEILASKLVITNSGQITGQYVTGNILAFENDGTFKWESDAWHGPDSDIEDGSAIGIADLDHDGHPEIFRGSSVFDHNGKLLWEGSAGRGTVGHGEFSIAADLDGQGGMELIAGNTAYHADGTIMWQVNKADGISAVADFNLDGKPEVLLFSSGVNGGTFIINGQTGAIMSQLPGSSEINAVAPPVIANIDGQGPPEIGVVGTCTLANPNPSGDNNGECFWGIQVNPSNLAMTQIWKEEINDSTLGGGTTGFDFNGDGQFEVLQNDEQWVNIYAGFSHQQIYHAPRQSVTGWELPLVVDVNNDGHAEIVLKQDSGLIPIDHGILVYSNVDNDWVATRRIWNQFDYHITNVRENGTIPRFEIPNWSLYNNFLTNEPFCQ